MTVGIIYSKNTFAPMTLLYAVDECNARGAQLFFGFPEVISRKVKVEIIPAKRFALILLFHILIEHIRTVKPYRAFQQHECIGIMQDTKAYQSVIKSFGRG